MGIWINIIDLEILEMIKKSGFWVMIPNKCHLASTENWKMNKMIKKKYGEIK